MPEMGEKAGIYKVVVKFQERGTWMQHRKKT
jgi:hypothetical protein